MASRGGGRGASGEGGDGKVGKGKGLVSQRAVPRQQPPGQPGCFLHSFLGMNEAGAMPTEPGGVMSQVPKPDSIRHFDLPEPPQGNICSVGQLIEGECFSPLAWEGLREVAFLFQFLHLAGVRLILLSCRYPYMPLCPPHPGLNAMLFSEYVRGYTDRQID